jgi:hypothetical protein
MQSGIRAFVVDRPIDRGPRLANCGLDRTAPDPSASVARIATWAKVVTAALVVIATASAFDLFVLWIAAGRVIERMPF